MRAVRPVGYPLGRHVPRLQAIHYGIGSVRLSLPEYIEMLGCERVVVLTGRTLANTPSVIDPLIGCLGRRHLVTLVPPASHGEIEGVIALSARLQDLSSDCVISLGGGGAIDLGKAVACASGHDLRSTAAFDAYCQGKATLAPSAISKLSSLPHIAIPTTLAGAQHTAASGFTDPKTNAKRIYSHPQLLPQAVFLDPEFTLATPADLWASSGIKALDHVVEKYYAVPPHPIIDALAIAAAPVIYRNLSLAMDPAGKDALAYRLDLLIGSWQAMFGSAGVFKSGLSHALGRQLGAVCGVAHGLTSCVTLPAVIEFNLPAAKERIHELGIAFGVDGEAAHREVPGAVRSLIQSLGLPVRLRDVGVSRDHLPAVARRAMSDPAINSNPRAIPDVHLVEELLGSIW